MLETIAGLPEGITGVRATGKVTNEQYDAVLGPILEAAQRNDHRIRLLYVLAPDFVTFNAMTTGNASVRALRRFEGFALVSDLAWVRESARLFAFLMPCPVQVFAGVQAEESAIAWLEALPKSIEPGTLRFWRRRQENSVAP
jgi:hypothetical protein